MTPFTVSQEIIKQYESGFQGYVPNPEADEELTSFLSQRGYYSVASDAIDDYNFADIGRGKLSLPFLAATQTYPGCLPGGAQGRGSCVAWSTRNAALVSYCAFIVYGPNTERLTLPFVSPVAIDNGVASTEAIYWFRAHGGDGWQCSAAAQVAISEAGLVLRQAYPDVGLDLTEYSAYTEGKWGLSKPPEEVRAICKAQVCANATVCEGYEEVRDMLAAGYALSSCGSEAFSKERDAYGLCERSNETWHHAMAIVGVDDRPETVDRYKGGIVLIQNSWGNYLRGPDQIIGTTFRIPVGSFWARWRDVKDRYFVALGPSRGWPAAKLPDWGLRGII
jgi:hypothetical protein